MMLRVVVSQQSIAALGIHGWCSSLCTSGPRAFITAALEKKSRQQGCSSLPCQLSHSLCSGSGSWTSQQAVRADAKRPRGSSPPRAELYLAIPQTHGGGRKPIPLTELLTRSRYRGRQNESLPSNGKCPICKTQVQRQGARIPYRKTTFLVPWRQVDWTLLDRYEDQATVPLTK